MNSAIRVFNDAVVADDTGGMVSEKVRGLILVATSLSHFVLVEFTLSLRLYLKGGAMFTVVVKVHSDSNTRIYLCEKCCPCCACLPRTWL